MKSWACMVFILLTACKFKNQNDLFLLCNDSCLSWELVSCESNVENLQSDTVGSTVIKFCANGKGEIISDVEKVPISWEVMEDSTKSLSWTDKTGHKYTYELRLLRANKMVLHKNNGKTDDYFKQVVCTYKPLTF